MANKYLKTGLIAVEQPQVSTNKIASWNKFSFLDFENRAVPTVYTGY
jgi:hypothetical protein